MAQPSLQGGVETGAKVQDGSPCPHRGGPARARTTGIRNGLGRRMAALLLIAGALAGAARAASLSFSVAGENPSLVRTHHQEELLRILLVLLAAILVRLLFAVRLARMVSGPVRALEQVARTISEQRNYAIRAELEAQGEIGQLVGAFNDMLDQIERHEAARREAELRLRASEERYELAARGSRDGLWDHDVRTGRTYQSARLNAIQGDPEVESWISREAWVRRLHPEDRQRIRIEITQFLQSERATSEMEFRVRHTDGGYRWMLSRAYVVRDAAGRPLRIAGSQRDVTAEKATDSLTGLGNRLCLLDHVAAAMEAARGRAPQPAVLLLDIDHARLIDESLGRAASEEVLVQLTGRLRTLARWSERDEPAGPLLVARVGGDEFALLLRGAQDEAQAVTLAERILDLLREPFFIEGQRLSVSASIGIAEGSSAETAEELLQNAESAMRAAAAHGRGQFAVFQNEMRRRAAARLEVHQRLHQAIARGELRLHYQPVVSLPAQRIIGFEALVRWQHPERGLMGPGEFIPVAEETEVILDVGRWVLEEACRTMAEWQRTFAPYPPLSIGVNLSARQMNDPGLVDEVRQTLANTGVEPQQLRLEITESSVIANSDGALAVLHGLRRMQVGLVIDDFGTGYSSLSYLQRLPFGTLKIDRSFVNELDGGGGSPEIVRAILTMARSLNIRVIAEGVERRGQVQRLMALGCDLVQGYYFGQPAPAESTRELIRAGLSVAGMMAGVTQAEPSRAAFCPDDVCALPLLAYIQSAAAGFD